MSESIIHVIKNALSGCDEDRETLLQELDVIRENSIKLHEGLYQPYEKGGPLPFEFRNPGEFQLLWNNTNRALGNTVLMVMPPSTFFASTLQQQPQKEEKEKVPTVVVTGNQKEHMPQQVSRGFWSGIMDLRREKVRLEKQVQQKPDITTGKVTKNPQDVVYQLIPRLMEIKKMYFRYLNRHRSSRTVSHYLIKEGHMRMQEEMSKYFNVVYPFCYASIRFQTEKIRRDKLGQLQSFSKIAQAEAEAKAFQMPYIPPEVRAFTKAMSEGRGYHPGGLRMPSSDEVAERERKR